MAITIPAFRQALPASAKFGNSNPPRKSRSTKTLALSSNPPTQFLLAKDDLLSLIADQERGLKTQGDPSTRSKIIKAIEALAAIGKDTVTTDASLLSATWRMLWTTEKEQLFIIKNAPIFGTQAGDVLQVIDVVKGTLNNVITFPPSGVFFVRSTIEAAPPQRVNFKYGICNVLNSHLFIYLSFIRISVVLMMMIIFHGFLRGRFTSAVLKGKDWEFPLPPFGQGW